MKPNNKPPIPRLDHKRIDELFEALPPLGSREYLERIKQAPASELPAQVLVRAYRQLPPGSPEATATLSRLLGNYDRDGYLAPLWQAARHRLSGRDWFGVEDLVAGAIEEIVDTLSGPRGKGADTAWIAFLHQRLEDAYRALVGRRGERQDVEKAEPTLNEDGELIDALERVASEEAAATDWHGRVEGNDVEWMEQFVARELAKIADDNIREVARDLFSPKPTSMKELENRYSVDRFQIHRWREIARTKIYAALQRQSERDIDISWLKAR
ncbi:MAG: hypothetical protein JWM95_1355 [Gemmatimonadetes bacterium]|nr:hypothetical protein [Gemmatimonadota bacterium]